MSKLIDLTGKKFGRLTVLERHGTWHAPCGQTDPLWLCRCECGVELLVRGISLRSGNTRSCGCLRSEIHAERCRRGLRNGKKNPVTEGAVPILQK